MLKFCSLYSGSTGNSSLIQSNNTNILIDAGESAKKIVSALSFNNIDISNIDAILVTHEHSDHIKSIGTLSKKYNIPVYANKETWNAMPEQKRKIPDDNIKTFNTYSSFEIMPCTNMDLYSLSCSSGESSEDTLSWPFLSFVSMTCTSPKGAFFIASWAAFTASFTSALSFLSTAKVHTLARLVA